MNPSLEYAVDIICGTTLMIAGLYAPGSLKADTLIWLGAALIIVTVIGSNLAAWLASRSEVKDDGPASLTR